jgi:hypothetical protein
MCLAPPMVEPSAPRSPPQPPLRGGGIGTRAALTALALVTAYLLAQALLASQFLVPGSGS